MLRVIKILRNVRYFPHLSFSASQLLNLCLCAWCFCIPAFAQQKTAPDDDSIAEEFLWSEISALPESSRPKVGLALSGGGARAFAHVGVLEVLRDAGFPIDKIAGTSMGAVVGALYGAGMSVADIWELGRKASFTNASRDFRRVRLLRLLVSDKLLSSKDMENFIVNNIGNMRFDQMGIPFACIAMDLKTGEKIVFREGLVAPAVRASINLPGLFAPVEYRHRYLVDGGVVDFIPVDEAKLLGAGWVLASVADGDFAKSPTDNVLLSLMQVMDIRGSILARESRKKADFVIEPHVGHIKSSDWDKSIEAGEKGVEDAYLQIDKAKRAYIGAVFPELIKKWLAKR